MRARNPATTHDQQLALSGKGSGRSLGGGGQGVSLLGGHSHPSIFFLQSFAFFSPPLTCRPHSRPAVRDTYSAGGRNVWNAGAMQVSPLMTPSPHSPWRPPTPPALAHTSYLSEFWQCQPWNISTISIYNFSYQLTPAALALYLSKLWPYWWISTTHPQVNIRIAHPHTYSLTNKEFGQSFRPCGF